MSVMLQPSRRRSSRASLATPLIFQKYANMPWKSLQGHPTAAFTRDELGTYAGNGGLMGKFGFKMKKKPKKICVAFLFFILGKKIIGLYGLNHFICLIFLFHVPVFFLKRTHFWSSYDKILCFKSAYLAFCT